MLEGEELGEGMQGDELDFSEDSSAFSLLGEMGKRPSFTRFFCFIRRYWNQIFTWVSLSCRVTAISTLWALVRYLLK